MRPHTMDEARTTVETVHYWQQQFENGPRKTRGVGLGRVLPSGRKTALPDAVEYEGFPQHENGVGMIRAFRESFEPTGG